ncbi:MAG: ParA family protein [Desulfobacteraceae bacterium]
MGKTLTISGQKGGSGKSVSAVNISASLALFERKTLLVDCDPQASATAWMRKDGQFSGPDMASLFAGKAWIKDVIRPTELAYLDMIPSGLDLFHAAQGLSSSRENQKILRILLKEVAGEYEYIILDAPSSYEFLSMASIAASDWILAVMADQNGFEDEFSRLMQLVKHIRNAHKLRLRIAGILLNRVADDRTAYDEFLAEHCPGGVRELVFTSFLPEHPGVNLTGTHHAPAALYDIKSFAAERYMEITRELLSIFEYRK